jgi:hypothetical protein
LNILEAVRNFGAYFFKPVTASKLRAEGFSENFIGSLRFSEDPARPLYLMGVAVNAVTPPNSGFSPYSGVDRVLALKPIDDYSSEFSTPMSLVFSLKRDYDTDGNLSAIRFPTTRILEQLINSVGIAVKIPKSKDITPDEISSIIRKVLEKPVEVSAEKPKNKVKKVSLSRNEIIDLLKNERECVIRSDKCNRECAKCPLARDADKLVAMYDSVIKIYSKLLKQNKECKNVRMADGSRKFIPNKQAEALLKLPVSQRK